MATLTVSKEDEKRVKALGFLNNKGTDNFSARIITKNGKITAEQQICIGEAAKLFGNGGVTYTTRLTVEVQGVPYEKIDEFRAYIQKCGLDTGGTGSKAVSYTHLDVYKRQMELMVACQGIDMRGNKGLGKGTQAAYDLVRKAVATLDEDRELYGDINYCEEIIKDGSLVKAVEEALGGAIETK